MLPLQQVRGSRSKNPFSCRYLLYSELSLKYCVTFSTQTRQTLTSTSQKVCLSSLSDRSHQERSLPGAGEGVAENAEEMPVRKLQRKCSTARRIQATRVHLLLSSASILWDSMCRKAPYFACSYSQDIALKQIYVKYVSVVVCCVFHK